MQQALAKELADLWRAEFGEDVPAHVRARIEKLTYFGDRDGAKLWKRVLRIVEGEARARKARA